MDIQSHAPAPTALPWKPIGWYCIGHSLAATDGPNQPAGDFPALSLWWSAQLYPVDDDKMLMLVIAHYLVSFRHLGMWSGAGPLSIWGLFTNESPIFGGQSPAKLGKLDGGLLIRISHQGSCSLVVWTCGHYNVVRSDPKPNKHFSVPGNNHEDGNINNFVATSADHRVRWWHGQALIVNMDKHWEHV